MIITRDEWFGHRDPFYPSIKRGDREEFIDWDYALLGAVSTIEDMTDDYGLVPWELDDDRITVEASQRIHKFVSARDRTTSKKNRTASPGEYFVPDVVFRGADDEHPQTFSEWISKRSQPE